jgi:Fic family protein
MNNNKPFSSKALAKAEQHFRTAFTFSNLSMEGNSLTFQETEQFLEEGITVDERPGKDYYEAAGHAEAYDYMLSMARMEKLELTEVIIKRLHYLCCNKLDREAGHYRKVQVKNLQSNVIPPAPEEVPHFMEHFMNQMQSSRSFMHPIEFAVICHKRLLDIQPFIIGNGIIARLFMNLILVHEGYGITIIPPVLRNEYINTLKMTQRVNNPDIDAFIKIITECVIEAEKEHCRLLKIQ